ncbi:Gp52 [Mycolicibacterium canariasense]|uniref:Gp52 n=1 Tax=Mycolicibacterium canariasense TaxID=228230 RepID=A0A124E345_MYCCR|nr:hypothetical protein AWB94_29430 [Mycolicibacterium canariasense]GAS98820.1 Gp52 [Mycolicibacterium canariasense]
MTADLVLYRFFDADGGLLYIGQSVQAWARFDAHRKGAEFYSVAATITLERGFASPLELSRAELLAIRSERPRFNVAHTPNAPVSHRREVCQGPHHCGKSMGDPHHVVVVCRERDESEGLQAVPGGVHGCWEHGVLTEDAVWQARVLREAGEPVERIAVTLGVGRATLYRALRDDDGGA